MDYKLSAKTVSSIDEAIAHINQYNTGHSEAIITNNYSNAEKFLNEIDAACVYVNARTRLRTDLSSVGAEIGFPLQKLHAEQDRGSDRPDQHKIYYLREWTDPEINDKILTCGMFYKKTEHMFAEADKSML